MSKKVPEFQAVSGTGHGLEGNALANRLTWCPPPRIRMWSEHAGIFCGDVRIHRTKSREWSLKRTQVNLA